MIGLPLKGDHIDKFWFNLWHEIEHVLRGDGKGDIVIDDFDDPPGQSESERAANNAAADHCVPAKAMLDFVLRHSPMFAEKNMLGFAKLVKRNPRRSCRANPKKNRSLGFVQKISGEDQTDYHSNGPHRRIWAIEHVGAHL